MQKYINQNHNVLKKILTPVLKSRTIYPYSWTYCHVFGGIYILLFWKREQNTTLMDPLRIRKHKYQKKKKKQKKIVWHFKRMPSCVWLDFSCICCGANFIFLYFWVWKCMIMSFEQGKIKFAPRTKLHHNIYTCVRAQK